MATDQKKALDERTKKLSTGRVEDGKEHSAYQESQQQLLAIQAEQQQNLAVARAESKADFNNTQTLAQAAEIGAISAAEAEQAAQAGGGVMLNPATQTVLSKYGVGQPKFSRSQSHTQQVTKQNIVINNNVTSNTTNDVKVPANIGGPLQGRPLQFKEGSGQGGSTGKFKAWISSTLNRQKEEGARRDREYRNRETSLTKSASRMMRKLEDIGKTIGSRMDPRKIGSTWMSQLKTLFLLFGFGYITSNWTKILSRVSKIEKWFKGDFLSTIKEYFSKVTGFFGIGKAAGSGESGFHKMIREFFGGKPGEGLFESFKKLLFSGDESLLGYVKLWLKHAVEERAEAIKLLKFPKLDINDVIGSIGKVGQYLGDLFSVILGGTKSVEKVTEAKIKDLSFSSAAKNIANDDASVGNKYVVVDNNGNIIDWNPSQDAINNPVEYSRNHGGNRHIKSVDRGIWALMNDQKEGRTHFGLSRYSIDSKGNLTGSAESTVAQSLQIASDYDLALSGFTGFNDVGLAGDLKRLHDAAAKKKAQTGGKGNIPISEQLVKRILPKELYDKLIIEGKIIEHQPYHIVEKPKSKINSTQKAIEAYVNKELLNIAGVGGIQDLPYEAGGAAIGAAIGTAVAPGAGTAVGGGIGWLSGKLFNSSGGRAARSYLNAEWENLTSNDTYLDAEPGVGTNGTTYFDEITEEGVRELANYLSTGTYKNFLDHETPQINIDPEDQKFRAELRKVYTQHITNKEYLNGERKKLLDFGIYDATPRFSKESREARSSERQLKELQRLEQQQEKEEAEYLKNSRVSQAFGGGGESGAATTTMRSAVARMRNMANTNQSHRDYVNRMRPILKERLLAKSYDPQAESPSRDKFVPRDEVEEYADILTAQSSLESGWGSSNLSKKYNNYSGLTVTRDKPGVELRDSGGYMNYFGAFNSVGDWADYFINYLNNKWNAFGKGPSEYYNQLQNNPAPKNDPRLKGQKYATSATYIEDNLGRLSQVKSILGHSVSESPALTASQMPTATPQAVSTSMGSVPSDLAIAAAEDSKINDHFYSDTYGREVYLDEEKSNLRGGVIRTGETDKYKSLCTSGPAAFYRRVGGPELNGYWWDTGKPKTATSTRISERGFEEVWHGTRESANANEFGTPLPGDIMVQFGTKSSGENSAHAQMWNGEHWVSDTIQTNNTFVYSKGRMGDRSAILYRYTGNKTPTTPVTDEQRDSYYQQSGVSFTAQAQPKAEPEEQQSRSFLEIFKDQVTNFFSNFGSASDFVGDTIKDSVGKVFSDGNYYNGPITEDFTNYETYKEHEKLGKLPEGLPEGLSFTDWKGRVFDMTGSMPQNLDVDVKEPELNKPEQKILSQYIKKGPEGNLEMTEPEEAIYRSLIPRYTEDENYRNQLSEEQVAKIEKIIESDAEKGIQHNLPEVNPDLAEAETSVTINPESIELSEDQPSIMSFFDPKKFERKEDKITTIRDGVDEIKELLAENLNINSSNGYILSKSVEATTQGTMANVTAFKNLAGSLNAQQANSVAYTPSLMSSNDSTSGIS